MSYICMNSYDNYFLIFFNKNHDIFFGIQRGQKSEKVKKKSYIP